MELFRATFETFTKGVQWSPDGTCLLTADDDNVISLFEMPAATSHGVASTVLQPVFCVHEGETVYDYAWYPFMNSNVPATCCFVSSSRDAPLHLWDAFSGKLRATYRAYDHLDEIVAAYSVAPSFDGNSLVAGYNRTIRVFDLATPSAKPVVTIATSATRRSKSGQKGLISAIACAPLCAGESGGGGVFAAGDYRGSICLYDARSGRAEATLIGAAGQGDGSGSASSIGGVTQLRYSPDGAYLFSGSRRGLSPAASHVLCWDARRATSSPGPSSRSSSSGQQQKQQQPQPGGGGALLAEYPRVAGSYQRIGFDLDPSFRFLATGGDDGTAALYDLSTGALAERISPASSDGGGAADGGCTGGGAKRSGDAPSLEHAASSTPVPVNGVAFHTKIGEPYLAIATGARRIKLPSSEDAVEGAAETELDPNPFGLHIFRLERLAVPADPPEAASESLRSDAHNQAAMSSDGGRAVEGIEQRLELDPSHATSPPTCTESPGNHEDSRAAETQQITNLLASADEEPPSSSSTSSPRPMQNTYQYKTATCRNFASTGSCHFGEECNFVHGLPAIDFLASADRHLLVEDSTDDRLLLGDDFDLYEKVDDFKEIVETTFNMETRQEDEAEIKESRDAEANFNREVPSADISPVSTTSATTAAAATTAATLTTESNTTETAKEISVAVVSAASLPLPAAEPNTIETAEKDITVAAVPAASPSLPAAAAPKTPALTCSRCKSGLGCRWLGKPGHLSAIDQQSAEVCSTIHESLNVAKEMEVDSEDSRVQNKELQTEENSSEVKYTVTVEAMEDGLVHIMTSPGSVPSKKRRRSSRHSSGEGEDAATSSDSEPAVGRIELKAEQWEAIKKHVLNNA